jgi:acyl-coenzyme A thioesterase PaaI-like protein
MKELPHSKSCFVCGSQNRSGLNLRFFTDGRIVEARFIPGPEHAGFVGIVHGGITATVLDEVMVWACAVREKRFSFSAEMTVRYLGPIHVGMQIVARGEMIENKRDRLYMAKGELLAPDGKVLAASSAKYMPIRNIDASILLADFEGAPEQIRELLPVCEH